MAADPKTLLAPIQPDLFGEQPARFDGNTFDPKVDRERLESQLDRVARVMGDGKWWTLREIAYAARASEASVSARLREAGGLHRYRLVPRGTR